MNNKCVCVCVCSLFISRLFPQQAEESRVANEKRTAAEQRRQEELERREREVEEGKKRDALARSKAQKIDEQK